MTRLCLNSIVKNEAKCIVRMLKSVQPFISCFAICDTGSTDGTEEIIQDWAVVNGIPGVIVKAPFQNFSQARNAALQAARDNQEQLKWDYCLLVDADMELKVLDPTAFDKLDAEGYDMYQCCGSTHYMNRRLVSKASTGVYWGVTHEYIGIPTAGCLPKAATYFADHADGANRPEKFKRDIRLFKQDLKTDPTNVRTMYYLAQSYRDAGKPREAIKWYERRIKAGGWDEEVWSSMHALAMCQRDVGNLPGFIDENLKAFQFRPSRAEPFYELAKYYRERGDHALSIVFSEAGLRIPESKDALFVNDYVYKAGLKDEFSICAYYVGRREEGFKITDELALAKHQYGYSHLLADSNLIHYMQPLSAWCPSFKWQQIGFNPEENWIALNPSVTRHENALKVVVRTVNYRMDSEGRYLIRGLEDGTVNNVNPINTRNWLVPLNDDLSSICAIEIVPPAGLPCEYPLVVGFEDMRLFYTAGNLWTSSTVRQLDADGLAEQVLARIGGPDISGGNRLVLADIVRMRRTPRLYEKNWSPWVVGPDNIKFMYRPGHVVDHTGADVSRIEPTFRTDGFSGSSQLVPFALGKSVDAITEPGWLGIVHEARYHLGTPHRYYQHRFVWYGPSGALLRVSKPFFFNDKVIEFAAGLCWHPDQKRLVISYGWKDCEARIATVDVAEVGKFIWLAGQTSVQ